ncbi:hypothetical protein HBH92_221840 [Parastagonospora nodorum]|nr:hypothetical protein HBH50_202410 [Parastagonospora nodorum]KAH4081567.1 hypothetical protein HBH48_198060 [Parastagonospora nodorum]KAH4401621.1 hypothetical protein HBH92_221840 [Parastagonospora nodorum]KAH4406223.1 hypothetical protein HBH93_230400 [Parastagonospora nodorum]KAH4430783.1 hypothetical protein HBH91_235920 [Parastagonospora nodorum]
MSYNFWAWAQGTLDLDEEEKEQSRFEAEKYTASLTAVRMGHATTEEEANSVTVAQTTNRVRANTVDYDEEEKEQAMKRATSSIGKGQDDNEADYGSQKKTDISEFCSRPLPASTSTTTVSITIYETLTAATTIFVTNTVATTTTTTTTVTAAASPILKMTPPGLLQTVTTVPTIPKSPLDPNLFVTKGPTTSAARADDAVGIHISRGAVAATLFFMCVWVVVSGGIWIRGTHFHRAMLLVVPALFPPIFVGCFMQEIIAMNHLLLPEPFVRALLFMLGVCACLLFLEAFGVFAFNRQVWDAFIAWRSGKGWDFSWGWTRDHNARGERRNNMACIDYTERTERRRGSRDGRYVPAPW